LSHSEEEALRVQLQKEGDPTMEVMELTRFDQIYLEGMEKGREEGQRALLHQALLRRFGAVPESLAARIAVANQDDLAALLDQAYAAKSLGDLLS